MRFAGIGSVSTIEQAVRSGVLEGAPERVARMKESLTDLFLSRSNHEDARRLYDEAREMYRQVGDILGEANCIQSLGDIALRRSDDEGARRLFDQARAMYQSIGEPYSIGCAHRKLARITFDAAGQSRHVNAAPASWTSINRPDLVAQLDKEFPESRSAE